ncbi:four helix bundle protein [Rhizobium binae]|nr:four helix bundle protein [Rhizobium binae]NKL47142.1 four helix bundle protein [Rhizobium leguminosarum bv. viciae]MBX4943174.1 four helix bundle protein [Rhizobium binae]MBX4951688.1 four helix bundle protein [Rhizobium binae]MBX4964420.1 four helix bundle protein [Rhizobium binae]
MVEGRQTIKSYKDLKVWQMAIDLAVDCYQLTGRFPKEEIYGLTAQIRRAAGSIAANIAEGHGREVTGSFIQFLRISQGSLKELETHMLISHRIGLIDEAGFRQMTEKCDEIGRMIRALIRSLQEK